MKKLFIPLTIILAALGIFAVAAPESASNFGVALMIIGGVGLALIVVCLLIYASRKSSTVSSSFNMGGVAGSLAVFPIIILVAGILLRNNPLVVGIGLLVFSGIAFIVMIVHAVKAKKNKAAENVQPDPGNPTV